MFDQERTTLPIFVKLVRNSSGEMSQPGTNWFAALETSIAKSKTAVDGVEGVDLKNV